MILKLRPQLVRRWSNSKLRFGIYVLFFIYIYIILFIWVITESDSVRGALQSYGHSLKSQLRQLTENNEDDQIQREANNESRRLQINNKTKYITRHFTEHNPKSFKIYIYKLPAELNEGLEKCVSKRFSDPCFNTGHGGLGEYMYSESGLEIHRTWQFSLEVILHHRLLNSSMRTHEPDQADVFYIPYYGAVDCFCKYEENKPTIKLLVKFLRHQKYFRSDKMQVLSLGKIEREQASKSCSLLRSHELHNVTFIGIEQESNDVSRLLWGRSKSPLIVAPYPSYGHLHQGEETSYIDQLYTQPRPVTVLLAASSRLSNPLRHELLKQFTNHSTSKRPEEYYRDKYQSNTISNTTFNNHSDNANDTTTYNNSTKIISISRIWLVTPECRKTHHNNTLKWMQNSVFCLQPPGDSPTRKSFYDAVVAGCIPVIFTSNKRVIYPFERQVDYRKLTVQLPVQWLKNNATAILRTLETMSKDIVSEKQSYLMSVLVKLQYSVLIQGDNMTTPGDAVDMIVDEIKHRSSL